MAWAVAAFLPRLERCGVRREPGARVTRGRGTGRLSAGMNTSRIPAAAAAAAWERQGPGRRRRLARRAFLVGAAWGCAGFAGLARLRAAEPGSRELIRDPAFQRGLRACRPAPGRHDRYGELTGFEPGPPVWDLLQWSSREPLPLAPTADGADLRTWSHGLKSVSLGRSGAGAEAGGLVLSVQGWEEYGTRARRDGEPWVHLLVEQFFDDPPSLTGVESARFRIGVRLLQSRLRRTEDYSTSRHAAQFQVFFTIQNRRRESAGFGRLLWFGIPLYDDRHRVPPEHRAKDTAGSGMYIYTPSGSVYASASAHEGGWVEVDRDLRPLWAEALESAWARGFLTESRDPADYHVTGMNLGWEVPGILDVSMRVKDLSLVIRPRPAGASR